VFSMTLILIALVAAGPPTVEPPQAGRSKPPTTLSGAVQTVDVPSMLIKIDEQVDVAARDADVLAAVNVREGQTVEKGVLIAQLEDNEARVAVERAKLEMAVAAANAENDVGVRFARKSLEVARAELHRSADALERYAKSVSASEMDRLQLLVDKSKVEIEQAEHEFKIARYTQQIKTAEYQAMQYALQRRRITAPLSGLVVQVLRHRGEWVKPGETVARIVRLDHLRAEGFLPSRYLSPKLDGRKVRLSVDLPGDPSAEFPGKIVFIDPEIDPVNAQVQIRVEVLNDGLRLRPGMRAKMLLDLPR
jgi:multidrug efflux pump subunit AcrA (membrane-fusion protein)